MRVNVTVLRLDCEKPLLEKAQENKEVELSSSAADSNPQYAVFSSGKAWCTSKTPIAEQYLQVHLTSRVVAILDISWIAERYC